MFHYSWSPNSTSINNSKECPSRPPLLFIQRVLIKCSGVTKFALRLFHRAAYRVPAHGQSDLIRGRTGCRSGLVGNTNITNQPSSAPHIRIIPLVPIHKGLPESDSRHSRPTSAQTDIVLVIEEVGSVPGIQVHCFKPFVRSQGGTSPLPQSTNVSLTAEPGAVGDGGGMPVVEGDVGILHVDEEGARV